MDLITLSILKPKTETEIFQIIKKMSPSEIFRLAIKHNIVRLVDYAVSQGLNLQDVYGKYCYRHYGYGNIKIRYKKNVSYLEFLYLHHKGLLDHILKNIRNTNLLFLMFLLGQFW